MLCGTRPTPLIPFPSVLLPFALCSFDEAQDRLLIFAFLEMPPVAPGALVARM
jgi:hypothetical protein